ncbi:class I SAM-dependent methyltransferase [Streptomyces inhibens]|uniref:class I SAM-dependent methyltransferase n=1 Tax=Streptomyces inhibens TaxID=2293571 RepID=UPI00402A6F4E
MGWVCTKLPNEGGEKVPGTPFDASERQAWANSADAYEASFGRLCAHPIPRLLDAAGVRAGTRVLDVGTGTGSVAVAAGARGARVTAVDADPGMARRAAYAAPDACAVIAALPQLPFSDGKFDAVVGNFVLNHVGRPRAALDELRRVTRPGGRIALTLWAAPRPRGPAAPGQALLGRAVRAAGVATIGRIVIGRGPAVTERIRRQFAVLAEEFTDRDGSLVLPHAALLASGRVAGVV